MGKIKLNERQLLMLKKLEQSNLKGRVLRITESQYNKLFKDKGKSVEKLEKTIEKSGMVGENSKKIDLVDFAQEIIVFIKDVLSNDDHRRIPFSSYWSEIGLNKNQLFKLIKKHNLLNLVDESEVRKYISSKHGFRKNIKELHNTITEWGNSDGGYPPGANYDPKAPWNMVDSWDDPDVPREEIIKVPEEKIKFKLIYMGEDGMSVFQAGNELYVASISDIHTDKINGDPELVDNVTYYYDYKGAPEDGVTPKGFEDYINDAYSQGEIKPVRNDNTTTFDVPTLATPTVKSTVLKYYGDDPKMVQALKQLPETTTAASSGSYVGSSGFDGPIKRGMSHSPEDEMSDMISEDIDPTYTHFAIFKGNNKIVNGWEYNGVDNQDIKEFSKMDIIDNFPDFKPSQFKIVTKRGLEKQGINPFDTDNWGSPESISETTSTATVGAGVGANGQGTETNPQYAYDAPAGDGSDFWNAGNKQNRKMKGNNMPIVKGGKVNEDNKSDRDLYLTLLDQWKKIKTSSKENQERKNIRKNLLKVAKSLGVELDLAESNMNKTAFPDGEMVSFDNCTKLNNNKVAQNGGCSQGDTGVVKTKKTKGSVVAENFNPQVGAGSLYAVEVSTKGTRVLLTQDNGQKVVVHIDDIPNLIKTLKSVY